MSALPIGALSVWPTNASHREIPNLLKFKSVEIQACQNQDLLKCNPQASSRTPNNTATLPGATEQQLKSIRQLGLRPDLKACAPGGVVHNFAINDGVFRAHDQFGRIGISSCGPHAYKPSRIHYPLPLRELKHNR